MSGLMLAELLNETTVAPDVSAESKSAIMTTLLDMLCATGKVLDRDLALRDLEANERRMSVGMEHGIAIPHAKTDAVKEMVAAIVITRHPLDIGSMDGQPAQIFLMTLSPKSVSGPHIRFLAEIGRLLRHKSKRQDILAARTRADLLRALLD
ncbi:MAG: PTS sugar transporter subunit IIA [Kiritimatiellia bacterium]|nr:PTS sugar transporter subunit IIA [Lentisphaerota bacterium]